MSTIYKYKKVKLFEDENLGCTKNAKLKYIYTDFKIETINGVP
jgi:hypothetical protein